MKYLKSDFYYDLPEELIAQTPAEPRDSSRLLVYNRATGEMEHRVFKDVTEYLKRGDVLVVNNTKVLPARLYAHTANGGAVEVLLLKREDKYRWQTLVKPGKKCRIGTKLSVNDRLSLEVEGITDSGERIVRFIYDGVFEEILDEAGNMPLPPYIKKKLEDKNRYQTVYAKRDGSAAAPTAGLHFTPELLKTIKDMGVEVAEVLLHVGLGTFRPVKEDIITDHKMHSEYYEVSEKAAEIINKAKRAGRRIIYRRTECLHPAIQGCDVFQAALALRPGTLPGQGRGKGKGDLRSHLPTERQIPDAGRSPFGHSADEINPYRRECLVAEMPLVTGICLAK